MTQMALAEAIGTHQTSLSQIELGIRGVGLRQIVKFSRALRVSADRLLGPARANTARLPRNEKLLRRVRQIEKLPSEHQDAVVKMLDAFLDTQTNEHSGR